MATPRNVGIVGCGTIGRKMAAEIDRGAVPGARLAALNSRDMQKAAAFAATLSAPPPVLPLDELAAASDMVVETATGEALDAIAKAALGAGKDLMVLSCGALLGRDDLFEIARHNGATIVVPSGAIVGLDGVVSASAGRIESVTMVTRKPPDGLRGSPGADRSDVDLDALTEPALLYEGPVEVACRLFPANVNVSAALSLAGIGPKKTTTRVYADPTVTRNTHEIIVEGEFGRFSLKIENTPSPSNPRTGILSALSALATLKKLTSHLQVGT